MTIATFSIVFGSGTSSFACSSVVVIVCAAVWMQPLGVVREALVGGGRMGRDSAWEVADGLEGLQVDPMAWEFDEVVVGRMVQHRQAGRAGDVAGKGFGFFFVVE